MANGDIGFKKVQGLRSPDRTTFGFNEAARFFMSGNTLASPSATGNIASTKPRASRNLNELSDLFARGDVRSDVSASEVNRASNVFMSRESEIARRRTQGGRQSTILTK